MEAVMRTTSPHQSADDGEPRDSDDASVMYRELFAAAAPSEREGYRRIVRGGTGLVTISARHSALAQSEADAISRFRLHQYVLAGLYDGEIIQRLGLATDPAMSLL